MQVEGTEEELDLDQIRRISVTARLIQSIVTVIGFKPSSDDLVQLPVISVSLIAAVLVTECSWLNSEASRLLALCCNQSHKDMSCPYILWTNVHTYCS